MTTYLRFEGYSLILVNAKDGANFTSLYFNLLKDFEKLVHLHELNYDLLQIFAMEVKVFYNVPMDFWRMYLNMEDIYNKYIKNKMWVMDKKKA